MPADKLTHNDLGYFADGEPTDKQIQLQDAITNATHEYATALSEVFEEFGVDQNAYSEYQIETLEPIWSTAMTQLQVDPDTF